MFRPMSVTLKAIKRLIYHQLTRKARRSELVEKEGSGRESNAQWKGQPEEFLFLSIFL